MSTVQLQGRDSVGPEPPHKVTDTRDEGPERVRTVRGRIRISQQPTATYQ